MLPLHLCPAASALHAALHRPLQLVRHPPLAFHLAIALASSDLASTLSEVGSADAVAVIVARRLRMNFGCIVTANES